MNFVWYFNRLKKMGTSEIFKRIVEHINIHLSRIKYRDLARCQYNQLVGANLNLILSSLPGLPNSVDWKRYRIYNTEFDLTKPINWYFSESNSHTRWPAYHYSEINYRPGNPYGDVRINWELNRLQFLPAMAMSDENLAKTILLDWLEKNPYLHGPAYIASMEVALRWFSIYWAICMFKQPLDTDLMRAIAGLAVGSGKFIESRLSTHSSAGNHLIIEAVGLFWLGKALESSRLGTQWILTARRILWQQIERQINPDGTNQEQSFWYLGFIQDALFHYLLLEDRKNIPDHIRHRIEKSLEFTHEMTLPDGSFPDYGDRDDGFVFRLNRDHDESPFPGLLNTGAFFFNRPEWFNDCPGSVKRMNFWAGDKAVQNALNNKPLTPINLEKPQLKTYRDGGMTLMQWSKGRMLFRHAPLGLENTYGHGHADALSLVFFWDNHPVLVDLGSGQYNGNQDIRNFFRSTIAHNTVEVGGTNQATILGPFMWQKSYRAELEESGIEPHLFARANHNGYLEEFSVIHTRKIEWLATHHLNISDSLSGPHEIPIRGAFHLGPCRSVLEDKNMITADYGTFKFSIIFPAKFLIKIYFGSKDPFMGWRSEVYGKWEPIHSILYSSKIQQKRQYDISLKIS